MTDRPPVPPDDLGRRAIGIEIDRDYAEAAVQRLAQSTLDMEGAA